MHGTFLKSNPLAKPCIGKGQMSRHLELTKISHRLGINVISFTSIPEISRVQSGGSKLGGLGYLENRDPIKYVDVYRERPIRLTVRVLVPVREHPKVRVAICTRFCE